MQNKLSIHTSSSESESDEYEEEQIIISPPRPFKSYFQENRQFMIDLWQGFQTFYANKKMQL